MNIRDVWTQEQLDSFSEAFKNAFGKVSEKISQVKDSLNDMAPEEWTAILKKAYLKQNEKQEERHMTKTEILEKAAAIVTGEREQNYGKAEDSFGLIAALWEPYLKAKCVSPGADVDILPEDVAMMMALLKIARIAGDHATEDSFVDLAGYAACGGEIATNR